MSTATYLRDLVLVVNPGGALEPAPRLAAAARVGGGLGVLDLACGDDWALRALAQAVAWSPGPLGVRVPAGCLATPEDVERVAPGGVDLVVVEADAPWTVSQLTDRYRVIAEVTDLAEARAAAGAGAHGLIARGMESGGRVSALSSFVLLQQVAADPTLAVPIWVAGGIGPRTAAACLIGGAAGVVLDTQLTLMPESSLDDGVRAAIRRMDGTEPVLIGGTRGLPLAHSRERNRATTPPRCSRSARTVGSPPSFSNAGPTPQPLSAGSERPCSTPCCPSLSALPPSLVARIRPGPRLSAFRCPSPRDR